jgi:hypothetical protein
MAFYVVTYDLRKKDEFDYQELWDAFDQLDAVKFQESDYLLATSSSITTVKNHFKAKIHEDDLLMVIEFTEKPEWTRGLKGTTAWVSKHFP